MLSNSFEAFYLLLRDSYYRRVTHEVGTGKGALSATECFCLEVLLLLDRPTISQFAAYVGISLPSANYRINSLIEKGYLQRVASEQDRRESRLIVSQKYADFYGSGNPEVKALIEDIEAAFSPEELSQLIGMVDRISGIMREKRTTGEMHD